MGPYWTFTCGQNVMAAILFAVYPDKAPHMFAYMRTLVRASCTFESSAWAAYNIAYRCQAANRGLLDCGVLDADPSSKGII